MRRRLPTCFSDKEPSDQGPRRVSRNDLDDFAEGWVIESVDPSEYEVRPDSTRLDSTGFNPSERGPKVWFVVMRMG